MCEQQYHWAKRLGVAVIIAIPVLFVFVMASGCFFCIFSPYTIWGRETSPDPSEKYLDLILWFGLITGSLVIGWMRAPTVLDKDAKQRAEYKQKQQQESESEKD
ncbi:MAG: hypothetical protein ACF8OB_03555 [Phycisphaeraceae bacterium JB051]